MSRRGISRRRFVGAVAGGVAAARVGFVPARARAAEFSYKFASNFAVTHPAVARATEYAEKIKAESKGRLEIQLFPASQLGGDTDMLQQVRTGAIEFFTLSGLILATLVPVAAINGLGFAFKDYDAVWKAMDGPLGAHVRAAIAKSGLLAFEKMWDNGYRQMTSSTRPINGPDDLKGFKIRVPVSPLWTSMFKAFGASPASINFSEVYSALQTHIVEGEENPLAIIDTGKLYEVQKYCSLTNHMWDGFWFLANPDAWGRLPPDLQEIVTRNINECGLKERADVKGLNDTLEASLQKKGMTFNRPDPAPFRDALRKAGFYADWKAKFGPEAWGILEQQVGSLA